MRSELAPRGQPPGTEFFDAETERRKCPLKRAEAHRDKSPGNRCRNPRRNALFGVLPETWILRRLDGGHTRARTWDPMIKSQQVQGGVWCSILAS
jgi:hypothetical protein